MKNKKKNLETPESEPRLSERADDHTIDDAAREDADPAALLSLDESDSSEDVTVPLDTLLFLSHLPCHYELSMVPGPNVEQ